MQKRIYGVETEYALSYQSPEDGLASELAEDALLKHFEESASLLLESLREKGGRVAGEFLDNGGRLYIDRGGHPEYATPECGSVTDLVAHEKAGDRLLQELVEAARSLLVQKGREGRLFVFKNNVDFFGNTYGAHENYLITPAAARRIEAIIPFLVTRQIFAGAGKLAPQRQTGDVPYQLSQRADFFQRLFNDTTSRIRGIINTRKRGIPQPGQNRRLHIIVGDSNMSEYAIAMKIGSTGLVLRLLEEGAVDGLPTLAAPIQALKTISRSPNSPLRIDGREQKYTAQEIQSIYLEKVERFFCSHKPTPEEKNMLDYWSTTLQGLRSLKLSMAAGVLEEDPADLKRRIDWVLKMWLLNRISKKNGLDFNDPQLRLLDLKYHDLDAKTGIFQRCQALDLTDRLLDDEEICRAKVDPPKDTRAWARGMLIRNLKDKNVEVHVEDWERIRVSAPKRGSGHTPFFLRQQRKANSLEVTLEDPFNAEDPSCTGEVRTLVETWDDGDTHA